MDKDVHDYSKINKLLSKSLSQFRLGYVNVTQSVVINLDYLIINFCYFSQLDVVVEYFCSENKVFNDAFYNKIALFLNIINYSSKNVERIDNITEGGSTMRSQEDFNGYKDELTVLEKKIYNISLKKHRKKTKQVKHRTVDYDRLDESSKNKYNLWRGKTGNMITRKLEDSWLRYEDSTAPLLDFNIFSINSKEVVFKHFFRILSHHVSLFPSVIINNLDKNIILKILEDMKIEAASSFIKLLLSCDEKYLFSILQIFREINAASIMIKNNKFEELEMYMECVSYIHGENDSNSSDQECGMWEYMMENTAFLFNRFYEEDNYFVYKPIYCVLKTLTGIKKDLKIPVDCIFFCDKNKTNDASIDNEIPRLENCGDSFNHTYLNSKNLMYIKLLCCRLDNTIEDIYALNIYKFLIDLFFAHPENVFLQIQVYRFLIASFKNTEYVKKIKDYNFFFKLKKALLRNLGTLKEKGSKYESIFSFGILLVYKLSVYYRNDKKKEIEEILEDGEYLSLVGACNHLIEIEKIRYKNIDAIDEWLEKGEMDEFFFRYIANLIVDRMPTLSSYLDKNFYDEEDSKNNETNDEKNKRLGSGMQDTI